MSVCAEIGARIEKQVSVFVQDPSLVLTDIFLFILCSHTLMHYCSDRECGGKEFRHLMVSLINFIRATNSN